MGKKYTFVKGNIVRHREEFLRSVSWYTDVPVDGLVLEVEEGWDLPMIRVRWSDGHENWILACNIERSPYAKRPVQPAPRPRMMPGQESYTPEELEVQRRLVQAATDADVTEQEEAEGKFDACTGLIGGP